MYYYAGSNFRQACILPRSDEIIEVSVSESHTGQMASPAIYLSLYLSYVIS